MSKHMRSAESSSKDLTRAMAITAMMTRVTTLVPFGRFCS